MGSREVPVRLVTGNGAHDHGVGPGQSRDSRHQAMPQLRNPRPGLVDKGYTGAGVGIHVPLKRSPGGPLHINNRCYNQLITALRAPTERGNALLGRWRALDRVTVCPQRIDAIAEAALVLTSLDRGSR